MNHPMHDLRSAYAVGPYNGTTSAPGIRLAEEDRWIAIESVAMVGGEVFLRDAPSRTRAAQPPQVRPAVTASLGRSLDQNADVWAELAKY